MKYLRMIFAIVLVIVAVGAGIYLYQYQNQQKQPEAEVSPISIGNTGSEPNDYFTWIAWWNDGGAEDKAVNSLNANADKIKHIMPMWYKINENGEVVKTDGAVRAADISSIAKTKQIELMPTITNDFQPDNVSKLLDSEDLQNKAIDQLVVTALTNGYQGWDIDWEELYVGDKQGFTDFVENLSSRLHDNKLLLSVTLQAKTGTAIDAPSSEAQDYKMLSALADRVILMAYDFHNADSEPGAITPISDYQKMIDIALKDIPTSKLVIGLPTYGYDWIDKKGTSLQYDDATKLASDRKLRLTRDKSSAELTASYMDGLKKHTVWYEDKDSTKLKIDYARSKGIFKFSFWRLGGEDDRIWALN